MKTIEVEKPIYVETSKGDWQVDVRIRGTVEQDYLLYPDMDVPIRTVKIYKFEVFEDQHDEISETDMKLIARTIEKEHWEELEQAILEEYENQEEDYYGS